jgi:hypothetical protein
MMELLRSTSYPFKNIAKPLRDRTGGLNDEWTAMRTHEPSRELDVGAGGLPHDAR